MTAGLTTQRQRHLWIAALMGWWYYFPAVLAFKTPIPLLILAAAGTWLMISRRIRIEIPLMALLILCVAMASHIYTW